MTPRSQENYVRNNIAKATIIFPRYIISRIFVEDRSLLDNELEERKVKNRENSLYNCALQLLGGRKGEKVARNSICYLP